MFTCSQVQINFPRSTINLIRVLQHTSLNINHSLLRDEPPSVWLRKREGEMLRGGLRVTEWGFVCVCVCDNGCVHGISEGPRVSSPCQPSFRDVMLQHRSGTWHMQGEHGIEFEQLYGSWTGTAPPSHLTLTPAGTKGSANRKQEAIHRLPMTV